MKKYFFLFCAFLLVACEIYTVKNNYGENIIVGNVVLTPSECTEFVDFPLIGDFPLQVRDKDRQLFSEEFYPAGNYVISAQGQVSKQDPACRIETVREPTDTEAPSETAPSTPQPETTPPPERTHPGLSPSNQPTPAPTDNKIPVPNADRIPGPPAVLPPDNSEEEDEEKKRSGRGIIQQ